MKPVNTLGDDFTLLWLQGKGAIALYCKLWFLDAFCELRVPCVVANLQHDSEIVVKIAQYEQSGQGGAWKRREIPFPDARPGTQVLKVKDIVIVVPHGRG